MAIIASMDVDRDQRDRIIEKLGMLWNSNPHLSFTQVVGFVLQNPKGPSTDLSHIEKRVDTGIQNSMDESIDIFGCRRPGATLDPVPVVAEPVLHIDGSPDFEDFLRIDRERALRQRMDDLACFKVQRDEYARQTQKGYPSYRQGGHLDPFSSIARRLDHRIEELDRDRLRSFGVKDSKAVAAKPQEFSRQTMWSRYFDRPRDLR